MGDIGMNATTSIIENLKKEVSERHIKEPMECKQLLIMGSRIRCVWTAQSMNLRTADP